MDSLKIKTPKIFISPPPLTLTTLAIAIALLFSAGVYAQGVYTQADSTEQNQKSQQAEQNQESQQQQEPSLDQEANSLKEMFRAIDQWNAEQQKNHEEIGHLFLTSAQREAIDAALRHSKSLIAYVPVNLFNRPQLVVLLGELHIKTARGAHYVKNLLEQFPLRAIEGASEQDAKDMNLENLSHASSLLSTVASFASLVGIIHPSSIYDAAADGLLFQGNLVAFKNQLIAKLVATNSPEKKSASQDSLEKEIRNKQNKNSLFARIERAYEFTDGSSWSIQAPKPVLSSVLMTKPMSALPDLPPVTINMEHGRITRWDSCLCHNSDCDQLIDVRNHRMAANIVSILHAFDNEKVLLVLSGMGHTPGLVELLSESPDKLSCPILKQD